jgi:outer membrane protein insertion porin family/translocation and assembly module TamA
MHRLVLSWALVLAAHSPLLAQKDEYEAPEVRRLRFEGVENVDVTDLERSLSTRASQCRNIVLQPFCMFSNSPTFEDKYYLDPDELRRDVLRIRLYYWKRGYRETEVDTTVATTGRRQVAVTFKVTEGPPTLVRRLAINYDTSLINERTRNRLTLLHADEPLDLIRLDSMRVLFQNELWDKGFGDAVVDTNVVVDQPAHRADVTLTLTPNQKTTIGRVTVAGNQRVDITTISNFLTFHTGDLYRQSTILESQRNLYESNLFKLATIYVPPQHDSVKNVTVEVTEAPLHEARFGPGVTNIDFFQFQAHYAEHNLFGGARQLDLDATIGNLFARALEGRWVFRDVAADVPTDSSVSPFLTPTYNLSANFEQPALFGRPADAAGIGVFTHRTINPGVFIDRGYGGQVTLTHQVAIRAPISLNYRFELNRVQASDTYFCVNYGVCDTLTIGALRSHQSLSPATLTGFVDRSDQPFSPTKGYVARFDYEHASQLTASDYRYNRAFFDAAVYGHRSGKPQVLSGHIRIGAVQALKSGPEGGVLHPRKRFYAGGANSVRGFAENQLGPRVLTIESTTLIRGATSIGGGICGMTVETVQYCDPNSPELGNVDFSPQPLGGTSLLEGSVEYRVPLPFPKPFRNFMGAVFIDAGIVGTADIKGFQSVGSLINGRGAITPGVGLRYITPVGPIRIDISMNPTRSENIGVVTNVIDQGAIRVLPLTIPRRFSVGRSFLDRLVLHFSIGEAY